MMKEELDKLTKHESTWEEFEAVEAWYMKAPDATKEKAADLWRHLYLPAAKEREEGARLAARLPALREAFDKAGFPLVLKIYTRAGNSNYSMHHIEIKAAGFRYEITADFWRVFRFIVREVGEEGRTIPYAVAEWDDACGAWKVEEFKQELETA